MLLHKTYTISFFNDRSIALSKVVCLEFYVGTSGWFYPWNEKRNLEQYVTNSGLNAVKLNASFYRFPFPAMVKFWGTKGKARALLNNLSRLSHIRV
jgi:hypothetical protein